MRRSRLWRGKLLLGLSFLVLSLPLLAQEVENQVDFRSSVSFSKKIVPKLKLELEPELRWRQTEGLNQFLLNSQLEYELFEPVDLFVAYRLVGDREEGEATTYGQKFQLGASGKLKLADFKPALRLMYTNFADDTESEKGNEFIRYRLSVEYNIPKCKLTPEIAFEGFYNLDEGNVYKYRSKLGLDYKISKKLKLATSYKLDYFMNDYKNRHIIALGLKVKL